MHYRHAEMHQLRWACFSICHNFYAVSSWWMWRFLFSFFLLFNTPFYGLFQLPDVIKLCNNAPHGFILFLTVIVQHDSKVKVTISNKLSEDEKLHQWMHVLKWIQVWYCLNFLCKLLYTQWIFFSLYISWRAHVLPDRIRFQNNFFMLVQIVAAAVIHKTIVLQVNLTIRQCNNKSYHFDSWWTWILQKPSSPSDMHIFITA